MLFWAACGACSETWSVVTHPDWLPPDQAANEVLNAVTWEHYRCPVKNRPNEMGFEEEEK